MLYAIGAVIISICVGEWFGAIWGFFVLGCFCIIAAAIEYLDGMVTKAAKISSDDSWIP